MAVAAGVPAETTEDISSLSTDCPRPHIDKEQHVPAFSQARSEVSDTFILWCALDVNIQKINRPVVLLGSLFASQ